MSESDSESNSESSLGEPSQNEIYEIFQICKRNHIKSYEQRVLLLYPQIINSLGENLLHSYIKNKGNDTYLMSKMLKSGMDLDNYNTKNQTAVDSLLKSKNPNSLKVKKLVWLLLHDCPYNNELGVKNVLRDLLKKRKVMTKDEFKNIKKLVEKGYFEGLTDLTDQQEYFPEFFCTTADMLEWFDANFKINWKFTMPFMNSENHIHSILTSTHQRENKCLDWLISRNRELIKENENAKFLKKLITDANFISLKQLYNHIINIYPNSIDPIEEKTIWSDFYSLLMTNNKKNNNYFSYQVSNHYRSLKMIFIYGFLHDKLQPPIYLGLIRKLNFMSGRCQKCLYSLLFKLHARSTHN